MAATSTTPSQIIMNKSTRLLLFILVFMSSLYVFNHIIVPYLPLRLEHEQKILAGIQEAPYQYRVFKPFLAHVIQSVFSSVIPLQETRHLIAYFILSFTAFAGIFYLFYIYLRRFFPEQTAIIGVLLLQLVIPFSVSGYYQEGDYFTLFFYLLSLHLIFTGKDRWLPVVIGIAALNREQSVFILVFYIAYLVNQRTWSRRSLGVIVASVMVYGCIYIGLRFAWMVPPTRYTISVHITNNTQLSTVLLSIVPLWMSAIIGFAIFSVAAYRKSNQFFRLGLLSLIPYTILFFFNGNMTEIAKFLPAYLVLIPMSLQRLTQHYVNTDLNGSEIS
jgi:4-amino-4-deoxy-L-arabinose transferase-like glycosyltransferase